MAKSYIFNHDDNFKELIPCPLCSSNHFSLWASENGFDCVRCSSCGLLFVNPRPTMNTIEQAVTHGVHSLDGMGKINVRARREAHKVSSNKRLIKSLFGEIIHNSKPFSWLDIGAGYGELVEALLKIAPRGSRIEGIEPMSFKVNYAQSLGLPIRACYLNKITSSYDFISILDIFSHIPDFRSFLKDIKEVLNPEGQILIKTGNAADIGHRRNFPGPLTLPDHLVFAGKKQLARFLDEAGFDIVSFTEDRIDGFIYCAKNAVKWILRKPVILSFPYNSPTRTLLIRAKLKKI